ncbi:MAG: isochorismatase family protein [Candidatus Marsarchaeota archaeon]|nr:isochorismatase family protein [Candidatus Marsarchaeota archaeon]
MKAEGKSGYRMCDTDKEARAHFKAAEKSGVTKPIYTTRPLRGREVKEDELSTLLRCTKAALLVVDVQKAFLHLSSDKKRFIEVEEVARKLPSFVDIAREYGVSPIWIRYPSSLFGDLDYYRVKPKNGDKEIIKPTLGSAMKYGKLHLYLKQNNVRIIFVAGVYTFACVWNEVHDAKRLGYNVIVLKDLVADMVPRPVRNFSIGWNPRVTYAQTLLGVLESQ